MTSSRPSSSVDGQSRERNSVDEALPDASGGVVESAAPPVEGKTSEARIRANRENARRSTGPRTAAGKARSRLNGLRHGLRAETLILPGEDAEALEARRRAWVGELAPGSEVERFLVEDAVAASWRMERCRRVETALAASSVEDAADACDHARAEEVEALADGLAADPRRVARRLRRSARGCRWLIERFHWLLETLRGRGWWEPSERDHALHLMGKRVDQIYQDPIVYDLCHAFLTVGWGTKGSAHRVDELLGAGGPPGMFTEEYHRRVCELAAEVADCDPSRARDDLAQLLLREIERLRVREARLCRRERAERARAAIRVAVDTTAEGQALLRYEAIHRRGMHSALRGLRLLRKLRASEPAVMSDELEGGVEPTPDSASVSDAMASSALAPGPEPDPESDSTADPSPALPPAPTEPNADEPSAAESPGPGERFGPPRFRGRRDVLKPDRSLGFKVSDEFFEHGWRIQRIPTPRDLASWNASADDVPRDSQFRAPLEVRRPVGAAVPGLVVQDADSLEL